MDLLASSLNDVAVNQTNEDYGLASQNQTSTYNLKGIFQIT